MEPRLEARPPRSTRLARPMVEWLERRVTLTAGTLRVVSYNIAAAGGNPRSGLNTLLEAMGNESYAGNAQPIDILLLQEVQSQTTTTAAVLALMNSLYGSGSYARGTLNGGTTGSGTQGIVYRTSTVQLLGEAAVGTASSSGQPRQTIRHHVQPVGYSNNTAFYIYNSHFKAADDTQSKDRRTIEAQAIRADADALGQGTQILYVGDFNLYTSSEGAYQTLVSAGNGQAIDPGGTTGSWSGNNTYRAQFTQAPSSSPPSGLTGGGLDDRFDFQLMTSELMDGVGIDFVSGTYRPFGNNGSVSVNGSINSPSNTALAGLSNRLAVLDLLTTVSDHLPVVAEYRVVQQTPTVQFSTSTSSVSESVGSFTINATLSSPANQVVTVPFSIGGTAAVGSDFTVSGSPLSFPIGSTTATATVTVINDSSSEPDETVILTLGAPSNAVLGSTTSHTATIQDNDGGVFAFSTTTINANEGNSGTTNATVTVNRTGSDLSRAVSVQYRTNGGTATAGVDYTAISPAQTLNFAAFESTKTFNVAITGDTTVESDETVVLELLNPTGGGLLGSPAAATLTILNDDVASAGSLQFVAATASTPEGNSGSSTLTILVSRSGGSAGAVSVPFSVSGGTATSGVDYTLAAGSLSWASGDTADKAIVITILGDTSVESDETIVLQLGAPTGGATLGATTSATATITNDDVASTTFRVGSLTPLHSGFTVVFTEPLDPATINLYRTNAQLGDPDVVLTRGAEAIPGSLIVDAAAGSATFLATGSALPEGTYDVRLRSGSNGFRSSQGSLLDGNADGATGDDYIGSFTLTRGANARVVSVDDLVLGAGQTIAAPLDVILEDGTGISVVTFKLLYDPGLLTVANSGLTVFPETPGFSASFNVFAPGEIRFSFASTVSNPLPSGPVTLLRVVGAAPTTAPYGDKARMSLQVTQLRQGFTAVPVVDDSGIQIASFSGDVSGDGSIDALDALFINELSVSNIDGFDAFQNADPNLMGDLSGDAVADALDALIANELAVGNSVPFAIPAIPSEVPDFGGGPDPIISLPRAVSLVSGEIARVPIRLEYTDVRSAVLMNADVMIGFDSRLFEVVGIEAGTLGSQFEARLEVDGDALHVALGGSLRGRTMSRSDVGVIAHLLIRPKRDAVGQSSVLNLLERGAVGGRSISTRLNSGRLTLAPAPSNAEGDAVDSFVRILPRTAVPATVRFVAIPPGSPPAGLAAPAPETSISLASESRSTTRRRRLPNVSRFVN
ncbi:MAG: Calx-beta domain-containing protein [Isosphaeraceae bacterium]|nr:Calx-beta domain-containing protein [Isosphaeraceae bacterium]